MEPSYFYKKGLCGLRNLGNTCYINSITQCMNNDRTFLEYFLTDRYKEDENKKTNMNLLQEFINIVKNLYKENACVTPQSYLLEIKKIASKDPCYQELIGYGQADSQEFLQFFLEKMHTHLQYKVSMTITGKSKNSTDTLATKAYNTWNTHFNKGYSKIIEHFYGLEYSNISSSTDSSYSSDTFSPFSSIAIPIPPNIEQQTCSLYDCLDNYTSKETDINHEQHNSDTNNIYDKQLKFWSLPNTLIIFIKRYDNMLNKKNNLITFPITDLNLLSYSIGYDNDKNIYDLFAISNHSGRVNGGHYWCYGKNSDGDWYNFNDENVSRLNPSEIITPNAYCLFYKRKQLS
jgi:ubiquitin C-terminal hydrolase